MVVIYAEKPDMAEKIASALDPQGFHKADKKNGAYRIRFKGKECAVTWGYGHLCALADADAYDPSYKNWRARPMPFFPADYKVVLNLKSKNPVQATYKAVSRLFHDADLIINATDYDREGELIFYYLYVYDKCRKPVMRAKLSSTTRDGITDAFNNLLDSRSFQGIVASARCRSIADWAVGTNLTVAMTLANGGRAVLPIGRVQTPTLAMVVARDAAVRGFKPETYYTLEGIFTTATGETYKGTHEKKKFTDRAEAEKILSHCGADGTVESVEKKDFYKKPPFLYSLDTVQMDANSAFGFTLNKTLNIIQKLYEKGFVTYPRTDSQFLPEDMQDSIRNVQEMLRGNGFAGLFNQDADPANMAAHKSQYFDDAKVGSHYAIIPTDQPASGLSEDEKKVYGLIADSVIRMLYPDARFEKTKVVTNVDGERFITNGSVLADAGWMAVHGSSKEELLPPLKENEKVTAQCMVRDKKTEPPKTYTDKTLLAAMKTAGKDLEDEELRKLMAEEEIEGIGTVATRAGIVELLVYRKLLARNGNKIQSTEAGRALIAAIPVDEVKSAQLTAQCEKELKMVMDGKEKPVDFMNGLYGNITRWCNEIGKVRTGAVMKAKEDNTVDLMCPVCGSSLRKLSWGYGCTRYSEGCKFSIGKIAGKMLSEGQVKKLLKDEKLGPLTGFRKKDGTAFEATLVLEEVKEDGKTVNYKVGFERHKSLGDDAADIYARCPVCGGSITKGRYGWECSKKCGASVPYELCGRRIEPEMAEALFANGQTPLLEGFISKKSQKPFPAQLIMEEGKVKFHFPEKSNY